MPYKIDYSPEAQDNLDDLSARNRVIVLTAIDGQLVYEPEKLTRNRKRLKPNKLNLSWELRVDKFRVFYRVEGKIVTVDLIGEKVGNRVYVGREISRAMKTLELSEATASLASYAQDATNEPVIITVDGQPYVALVTANDLTSIGELSVASSGNDRLHRAGANHPTIKRHYLRQAAQRKLEQDEREFEAEVESLSNNPRFIALLERSEARAKTEGTISSEEIRRRYGLDLGGKQWQSKPSPQLSAARIAAT